MKRVDRINLNSPAPNYNSYMNNISQVFTYVQTEINTRNFATVYYEVAKKKNRLTWWIIYNILILLSTFVFLYFSALAPSHIQRQKKKKPWIASTLLEGRHLLMATPQNRLHIFAFPVRICFYFNEECDKNQKQEKETEDNVSCKLCWYTSQYKLNKRMQLEIWT